MSHILHILSLGLITVLGVFLYPRSNSYTITRVFTAIRGTKHQQFADRDILRIKVLTAEIRLIIFVLTL